MSWQREKEVVSLMLCQVLDPTRHGLMVKLQSCSVLMLLLWLLLQLWWLWLWLWLLFLLLLLVEDRWVCMCLNDGRTDDSVWNVPFLITCVVYAHWYLHSIYLYFCSHVHIERIGHVEKTQHFLVTCRQGIGCKCGLIKDSDGKKNWTKHMFFAWWMHGWFAGET